MAVDRARGLELEAIEEVWKGLDAERKTLPFKLFYDPAGVALYLQICRQKEYYLTRAECSILSRQGEEIAAALGPGLRIIEPGAGAGEKIRLLLPHLRGPLVYVPIDIARAQLEAMALSLAADHSDIDVVPLCADFCREIEVPAQPAGILANLVFYPGASIGNFEPRAASAFLARLGRLAGIGSSLLVGVDLEKDPSILLAAYDDASGTTAAFNKNILTHLNREAGADFDLGAFEHQAVYETDPSRIEMRLVSTKNQSVTVAGRSFDLAAGESILTERCHKPSLESFADLAEEAGYRVQRVWTDDEGWFSLQLLVPISPSRARRDP